MTWTIKEKLQGNLAVLLGGESAEREISLQSGQSILQALENMGIPAIGIDCKTRDLQAEIIAHDIQYCFIALHGGDGEDGTVQTLLRVMGIPFTGGDALSSAISMNKETTKLIWQGAQLPTAPFLSLSKETTWQEVESTLGKKVMIKPASEGSSLGMSIVENAKQFQEALLYANEYPGQVMAEQWIDGKEYTVGMLNGRPLPVIRMETKNAFYDYEAKYLSDETGFYCPSGLSDDAEKQIQQLALQAFTLLGCSGWGRVDLMVNHQGVPYLLEVNTQPGMTSHSLVPLAAKAEGLSFEALVNDIMEAAF